MSNGLLAKLLVTSVYKQIAGEGYCDLCFPWGNSVLWGVLEEWVKNCIWGQRFKTGSRNPTPCQIDPVEPGSVSGHAEHSRISINTSVQPWSYITVNLALGFVVPSQKYKEKHFSCINSVCHSSVLNNSW